MHSAEQMRWSPTHVMSHLKECTHHIILFMFPCTGKENTCCLCKLPLINSDAQAERRKERRQKRKEKREQKKQEKQTELERIKAEKKQKILEKIKEIRDLTGNDGE